jgi:hypothetical protein
VRRRHAIHFFLPHPRPGVGLRCRSGTTTVASQRQRPGRDRFPAACRPFVLDEGCGGSRKRMFLTDTAPSSCGEKIRSPGSFPGGQAAGAKPKHRTRTLAPLLGADAGADLPETLPVRRFATAVFFLHLPRRYFTVNPTLPGEGADRSRTSMKPQTGWRWVRLLAGVVFPFLAAVLAAPATAHASCGDYVQLGGGHGEDAAAPRHLPPAPSPRPCSGPHCSRHLPSPLPPVAAAPVPVEDRCCPPALFLPDPARAVARTALAPCGNPSRSAAPVYHPPRQAVV